MSTTPSPQAPLTGSCLCGAVHFALTAPFTLAGYCHCTHCQHRSGNGSSVNARVAREHLALTAGAEHLRAFAPPSSGVPKVFCELCGGHLFSGDLEQSEFIAVRLGVLDGDPGIRPTFHQFVASAASWEEIPDDGLERFPARR